MSDQDTTLTETRRRFLQTGLAASALLPSSGHAQLAGSTRRPNIVFMLGEGQRADALSLAGNRLLQTPNHDRIGREGVYFRNAFVTNALCAPARAVILTG